MKNQTFVKKAGWLIIPLLIIAIGFMFPSTTTMENANYETISKLSAELAAVKTSLAAFETANDEMIAENPFIGEVTLFAGNFAPKGWAFCDGQILSIQDHQSLFSLLGTTYGGDGRTTFALPDLRGRVAMHPGKGSNLTERKLGHQYGKESRKLTPQKVDASPGSGSKKISVIEELPGEIGSVQPSLGINYIIALQGTYPSRN